ncbi:hypothetical protein LCGC14_0362430 [marine sediment metagenome]|uniref:DUF1353 domain-containing protein n=1 Tax=marine sediment metagenome TaxID=412755 RepID=A0A0F9T7W0_9ZZZZ
MKYFERNHDYLLELAEDETIQVPITQYAGNDFISLGMGTITIRKHYAWDGSSIPFKRLAQRLTFGKYDPDKYCKEASLVHDAFYQLMRSKLLSRSHKDSIDRLYERMCIEGATKIIFDESHAARIKILKSNLTNKQKTRKLTSLTKKQNRLLNGLPGWAARRYWAVKHFGARTLKPRYYPEKKILET